MTARESHAVELVDSSGRAVGSTTVAQAHQAPGLLHRAFSVFLRDPASGRVLLQQRAAVKTRFPLLWANSCCGHPLPGEDPMVAAERRLAEELGVTGASLTPTGVYTYRAEDRESGRVEHEYDHVLLGDLPPGARVTADPAEVADTRWVSVAALQQGLAADPGAYAPWLSGVTQRLAAHLRQPRVPRPNEGPFAAHSSVPVDDAASAGSVHDAVPAGRVDDAASAGSVSDAASAGRVDDAAERSGGR